MKWNKGWLLLPPKLCKYLIPKPMNTKVLFFNLPPLGGDLFPISLGYISASLAKHNIDSVIAEIDSLTTLTDKSISRFVLVRDKKAGHLYFTILQRDT